MKKIITKKEAKAVAKGLCRKFPDKTAEEILYIQKKIITWIFNRRKTGKNCIKSNMLCRGKIPDLEVSEFGVTFDWEGVGL